MRRAATTSVHGRPASITAHYSWRKAIGWSAVNTMQPLHGSKLPMRRRHVRPVPD